MKFVPCEASEVVRCRKSAVRELLMEIVSSGHAYVEVKGFPHKDAKSCAGSLQVACKRDRFKQLKVVTNKNRVFVINTLLAKEVDY